MNGRSCPSIFFLKTKRIGFRTWKMEDLPLAIDLWGDLRVTRFIDARGRLSQSQINDRLLQEIATRDSHGIQYWPIFDLTGGHHLGCCGLRPYDDAKNVLEIGFHICHRYWGHGYASEAAQAIIKYALKTLRVSGIFAGHNPENDRSRHLLTKLGFRYIRDEFYKPTGLNHPSYMLSANQLLEDDFLPNNQ